ncbi:MAG: hypothetical protein H0U57_14350 [Tatlockia sp.]|nr:hypothetical protein [Tatlockia sp.]
MRERNEEFINITLIGDDKKCLFFIEEAQGFAFPKGTQITWPYVIEGKFKIDKITKTKEIQEEFKIDYQGFVELCNDEDHVINCHFFILIGATSAEKDLIKDLNCINNYIVVEFDDSVAALDCLHGLELVNQHRLEKSLLMFSKESNFSVLPVDVLLIISVIQFKLSSNYSANSFFKAISNKPSINKEEEHKQLNFSL